MGVVDLAGRSRKRLPWGNAVRQESAYPTPRADTSDPDSRRADLHPDDPDDMLVCGSHFSRRSLTGLRPADPMPDVED